MFCLFMLVFWWGCALWGCLIVISLITDSIVIYCTLTGRNGEDALASFQKIAERRGGTRRWVVISLVLDILDPLIIWEGLLSARR
jgi:hypothetical protein